MMGGAGGECNRVQGERSMGRDPCRVSMTVDVSELLLRF